MATRPQISDTQLAATWQRIDDLFDEMAALAKGDLAARDFGIELLARTIDALAATGGGMWLAAQDPDHGYRWEDDDERDGLPPTEHLVWLGGEVDRAAADGLRRTARSVGATGFPRTIVPEMDVDAETAPGGRVPIAANHVLFFQPILVDGQTVGVLAVFKQVDLSAEAREGVERFLGVAADLASDYFRRCQLRQLRARDRQWEAIDRFARSIHLGRDLEETACAIVNEGRPLTGWDRLTLLIRDGRRFRVAAVSGVDLLERHSPALRSLEQLTALSAGAGMRLWYGERGRSTCPPEIEPALQAYLDESQARSLALLPLVPPDMAGDEMAAASIGAMVCERFEAEDTDREARVVLEQVCRHAAVAVGNGLRDQRVPLLRLWRSLGARHRKARRTLWGRVGAGLMLVGAACLALALIPADFAVTARGVLQPAVQRDVFAPADGVVDTLSVRHGQQVAAGATLLRLRNTDLDLQTERLLGELQTARQRLASLQAARLDQRPDGNAARQHFGRLSAEEARIQQELKNLELQYELIEAKRRALDVQSPIDGQIISWDLQRRLAARPVGRGQRLLTVADVAGDWTVKLQVPDDRIGYVLSAGEAPPVAFRLAGSPEDVHRGRVARIAAAARPRDAAPPTVEVTVEIDRGRLASVRPGTSVTARILCGRRPIGYVWLHDLWDTLRTVCWF